MQAYFPLVLYDRLSECLVGARGHEQVEILGGQVDSAAGFKLSRKAAVQISETGHGLDFLSSGQRGQRWGRSLLIGGL
jgi:hypothetical protein